MTVEDCSGSDALAGCDIDMPEPGATRETFDLEIRGWAVGRGEAAVAVELDHEGVVLSRTPLDVSRPKLAERHPATGASETIGFRALIGALRLPTEFELVARAVTEGGKRSPIGRLRGRRVELRTSFEPSIQPLMITTLGRTGSMMLMRMLEAHPEVLVYRPFRYEQRVASYWIEVMLSLCEPASYFRQIAPAGSLDDPRWWLGEDGSTPSGLRDEEMQRWLGFDAVRELAELSQGRIERLYEQVAAREAGGPRPAFFAEKYALGLSHLVRELYPGAREVFLVRDFRDMVCSIIAFNEKRGVSGFGRARAASDREYIEALGGWAASLVRSYEQRSGRSRAVRYEDLVLEPEQTLHGLLEYLGVTRTDDAVAAMAGSLAGELPELADHRTTPDPSASIGRWRQELSGELLEACEESFGSALETFGYEAGS